MSLKYPNKRKRDGYWKTYDASEINNYRKVCGLALLIVQKMGNPFPKKDSRGRKPKLGREYYAVICIFMVYFDKPLREMEGLLPLLFGEGLDHSTIDWWFIQFDDQYAHEAVKLLHRKIKKMFSDGEYIADSTKITTTRYYEMIHKGEMTIELRCLKLHLVIMYFASVGILSIESMFVSHGDAHDSPIFHDELIPASEFDAGKRIHADKAYFAIENIRECKKRGLRVNIVPKDNAQYGLTIITAKKEYDNEARKQNRGIIEGLFGGLTTDNNLKTRFVRDDCRKTHGALTGLAHEMRTYLRALCIKTQALIYLFSDNPYFPVF
jgi:hypothetical protein